MSFRSGTFLLFICIATLVLLATGTPGSVTAQTLPPWIQVSRTDTERAPTIGLTLYGLDQDGRSIDFTRQPVRITHNGIPVPEGNIRIAGVKPVGTLTLFLIDITPGVEEQIPLIKALIDRYGSDPTMQEGVDYVAIYEVDEITSRELLAPTQYHNAVRNFTAGEIEVMRGATALVDSLGELLTRIDTLKPQPEMAATIIVISDGTDAQSKQFEAQRIPDIARERGVSLHTITIPNRMLTFGASAGRDYMRLLAQGTNGIDTTIDNSSQTNIILERIAQRRNHTVIDYVVDDLQAGTFPVQVFLQNDPATPPATTEVTIVNTIPRVGFDLSAQSFALSLPSVENPVRLRLPVTLNWLDGVQRTVTAVTLQVNGVQVQEIPPARLAGIQADLPLRYGENSVQIVVRDDAGQEARSAPLLLTVAEGAREIPAELQGGSLLRQWLPVLLAVGLALILLVIGRYALKNLPFAQLFNRRKQAAGADPAPLPKTAVAPARPAAAPPKRPAPVFPAIREEEGADDDAITRVNPVVQPTRPTIPVQQTARASIEVLDAVTRLPLHNTINRPEFLIGRSTTVDLSLPNDPTVSRIHATIVQDNGIYRIYDEQSTSGTWVNDREVPDYGLQLSDGDEIHIGEVHLRFHS